MQLTYRQIGFKIFLNITPTVANWTNDSKSFSLIFEENPLADFVELPDDGKAQDELWFSNIYCGVLRGGLEMVRLVPFFCVTHIFDVEWPMEALSYVIWAEHRRRTNSCRVED